MENQWYENTPADSWYAPAVMAETAPGQPPRRRRWRWLVVPGALLGLVTCIAASTLLVLWLHPAEDMSQPPSLPGGSQDTLPDFSDDFRSFFDNYYTAQEEHEECTIPRVERFTDFTIHLHPADETVLTLKQVYEKCVPSVVAVTAFTEDDSDDRYYWGTGIVLTRDGYIVTNSHVVEGTCRARITLWDDREYDARLVGYDSRSDIAVLKIEAAGLTPAEFCSTDGIAVGDQVVSIGNPLGREFRSTMTEGIISGIDRDVSYSGTTMTLLQTSAPINEGNSGGPLINMAGQVVGITSMKMSNSAGDVTIEGVGFAIPSRIVKAMADSILAAGEVLGRPALGLTLGAIPDEAMKEYGLPAGLYVSDVSDGSDCMTQGIQEGDIITAVNGKPVTVTADVTDVIAQMSVGDAMELRIWRSQQNGDPQEFTVTVKLVDVNDVY